MSKQIYELSRRVKNHTISNKILCDLMHKLCLHPDKKNIVVYKIIKDLHNAEIEQSNARRKLLNQYLITNKLN